MHRPRLIHINVGTPIDAYGSIVAKIENRCMAMLLSRPMRIVIIAILVLLALFAMRLHLASGQIRAQDKSGDVSSGRFLAEAWCTECHSVERATSRTGQIAPDFSAIADRRSTTALSLRAFLQSEHKTMPNFIIETPDAADLIAYILSLRRAGRHN